MNDLVEVDFCKLCVILSSMGNTGCVSNFLSYRLTTPPRSSVSQLAPQDPPGSADAKQSVMPKLYRRYRGRQNQTAVEGMPDNLITYTP